MWVLIGNKQHNEPVSVCVWKIHVDVRQWWTRDVRGSRMNQLVDLFESWEEKKQQFGDKRGHERSRLHHGTCGNMQQRSLFSCETPEVCKYETKVEVNTYNKSNWWAGETSLLAHRISSVANKDKWRVTMVTAQPGASHDTIGRLIKLFNPEGAEI